MNRSFSLKMVAVFLFLSTAPYLHAEEQAHPLPITIKTKALYFNMAISDNFMKNDCPAGLNGSMVTYTVPMGTYFSDISQADADAKALNDLYTNGQSFANAFGTCSL